MSKYKASLYFITIATALFIFRKFIHHISAAIMAANSGSLSSGKYQLALEMTSTYSIVPEIIALCTGITLFVWSIFTKGKDNR